MNKSSKQKGVSLISLLVGLLVSSIVLLGMMVVFRNTIQIVVPASEVARAEGERIAALFASHAMLLEAGFGMDPKAQQGPHFGVFKDASLNGGSITGTLISDGEEGNAVLWTKIVEGDEFCEGLYADEDGGLWRVTEENCNDISGGVEGDARRLVEPPRIVDEDLDSLAIRITRAAYPCSPYGIGDAIMGGIAVTLTMPNATGQVVESTTCMVNIEP